MQLVTSEGKDGWRLDLPPDRAAELVPRLYWQASAGCDLSAPTAGQTEAVAVFVNEGRWIVECPDCRGAQLAAATDRRMMCHCCGNASIGGRFRPVVWPAASTAVAVERELARRPEANRNWSWETVAELRDETDAHISVIGEEQPDGLDRA